MDRKLSIARKGITCANGPLFSNEQLLDALHAVDRLVNKHGIHALSFPEEYYFVERTLIELGVLRASRGMTAHKAFFQLMDRIGYSFPLGRPGKRDLAAAAAYITADPFPWRAAPGQRFDDNEADLPRWQQIFLCLQRHLLPEDRHCYATPPVDTSASCVSKLPLASSQIRHCPAGNTASSFILPEKKLTPASGMDLSVFS